VQVVDERVAGGYPTPVTHAAGTDPVFVGRIREDISHPRGLSMWVVSDNIRKGAALGPVSQMVMAGLTGAYVLMGVRSFIAARRAREASAAAAASATAAR